MRIANLRAMKLKAKVPSWNEDHLLRCFQTLLLPTSGCRRGVKALVRPMLRFDTLTSSSLQPCRDWSSPVPWPVYRVGIWLISLLRWIEAALVPPPLTLFHMNIGSWRTQVRRLAIGDL